MISLRSIVTINFTTLLYFFFHSRGKGYVLVGEISTAISVMMFTPIVAPQLKPHAVISRNALFPTNLLMQAFWHWQFRRRDKPDGSKRVPTALDFYERVNFRRLLFFLSALSFSSLLRFWETRIPVDPAFHFYTLFSPSLPPLRPLPCP